jgi:hypothetical protein
MASLTETERGPRTLVKNLLFQLAKAIAVLKAAAPYERLAALRRARGRRGALVDQEAIASELIRRTPSLPAHSASGLPSTPCTPRAAEIDRRADT